MDNYQPKTRQSKIWLANLHLTHSDRDVLLNPLGWLNDRIIDASQNLLMKQFPYIPGLQNTVLGMTLSFKIHNGEFLQIINTSYQHWLTVSTIGIKNPAEVRVFDSLYDFLPSMAKAQVASIMCTQQTTIKIQFMDVQKQVIASYVDSV